MNAKNVSQYLDELAPRSLAYDGEEFNFIFGDESKDIRKIGVTWRPTVEVLKQAIDESIDLLITHEPLFHSEKSAVIPKDELLFSPNEKRRELLEKGNILVYRFHSQWDDANEGNNETLVKLFGLFDVEKIPFGRIGSISSVSLKNLISMVKEKLGCSHVLLTSEDDSRMIHKVAFVAGSGNSLIEMIEHVKNKGADVLVSGDIADGRARYAREIDLPVIDVGGYYSEKPGMLHLCELLKKKFNSGVEVVFLDTKKPWKVV